MRGNCTRYMLNYAGVDYEEKTFIAQSGDWKQQKDSLGLDFPNLPYIIDGDLKLTETVAVQQYIASKYKPELMGTTASEIATASRLHLVVSESMFKCFRATMNLEDRNEMAEIIHQSMDPFVAHLGSKPFLNGQNVSLADFIFFEHIEFLLAVSQSQNTKYEGLMDYHSRVKNLPGLKQFYESDKMVTGPFFPAFAKLKI